jgi:hypothetical protein
LVEGLGHDAVLVGTPEEEQKGILGGGFCYVLQDMHMPVDGRSKATAKTGEAGIAFARKHNPDVLGSFVIRRRSFAAAHFVVRSRIADEMARHAAAADRLEDETRDNFVARSPHFEVRVRT